MKRIQFLLFFFARRCPDLPQADINRHFDDCSEFIERAIGYGDGQARQ